MNVVMKYIHITDRWCRPHITMIKASGIRFPYLSNLHTSHPLVNNVNHDRELLLLGEEAEASPTIANTLWRVWTMLTRSAITPPEVIGFGWNLASSEYVAWSCPWQILGVIRAEAAAGARAEILFFFNCSSRLGSVTARHSSSGRQPNCGVAQRAPPMFGRATITLGIGPHSSSSCTVMGICDISLQNMSLTQNVLNDNLS